MSYVVEIIRPIREAEVIAIAKRDDSLTILGQGENWLELEWVQGDEKTQISLAQGRMSVTTPTHKAYNKVQELAEILNAEVIGEEEQLPERENANPGIATGKSIWAGWPILVLILLVTLIWRW